MKDHEAARATPWGIDKEVGLCIARYTSIFELQLTSVTVV